MIENKEQIKVKDSLKPDHQGRILGLMFSQTSQDLYLTDR